MVEDAVRVTLELKLILEKEQNSLFWVSCSSYTLIHYKQCEQSENTGVRVKTKVLINQKLKY